MLVFYSAGHKAKNLIDLVRSTPWNAKSRKSFEGKSIRCALILWRSWLELRLEKRSDIRRLLLREAMDQVIFERWCNGVHTRRGSLVDASVVKLNSPYTQDLVFHSTCAPLSRIINLTYLEIYISNPDISSEEKTHTPSFRYASLIVLPPWRWLASPSF